MFIKKGTSHKTPIYQRCLQKHMNEVHWRLNCLDPNVKLAKWPSTPSGCSPHWSCFDSLYSGLFNSNLPLTLIWISAAARRERRMKREHVIQPLVSVLTFYTLHSRHKKRRQVARAAACRNTCTCAVHLRVCVISWQAEWKKSQLMDSKKPNACHTNISAVTVLYHR